MSCLSILDPSPAATEAGKDRSSEANKSEWNRSGCFVPDPSIPPPPPYSTPLSQSPGVPSSPAESSSIGKNSDDDDECEDDDDGEDEVKSPFKGSFNASNMDALEEALPMRRGISRFYSGRSRSFACLSDASSISVKGIVKPENAYSRKRRNLLAHTLLSENNKTKTYNLIRSHIAGGISKKSTSSSSSNLSKLALAAAITTTTTSSTSISGSEEDYNKGLKLHLDSTKGGSSPSSPLSSWGSYTGDSSGRGGLSSLYWRSYSLADLQQCGGGGTTSNLGSPGQVT